MAEDELYPNVEVFGSFPDGSIEDISSAIKKKQLILTSLRNVKGIYSSEIEKLLIGNEEPRPPLTQFGYSKKRFDLLTTKATVDGFHDELGIAIEIEKGRGVAGNQIMLDLWKFIVIDEIQYGVIIIPTISREGKEKPFKTTVAKYSPLERKLVSIGIKGLAVFGY
jgi:hypothetical protein